MAVFFFGHYGGDQFISPLKVETIDARKHFKKNKKYLGMSEQGFFSCHLFLNRVRVELMINRF
jgi:hypothetical protein